MAVATWAEVSPDLVPPLSSAAELLLLRGLPAPQAEAALREILMDTIAFAGSSADLLGVLIAVPRQAETELGLALGLDTHLLSPLLLSMSGASRWSSPCEADSAAGVAKLWSSPWAGTFSLVTPYRPGQVLSRPMVNRCLARAKRALAAHRPTRIVLLVPTEVPQSNLVRLGAVVLGRQRYPNGASLWVAMLQNRRAVAVAPLAPADVVKLWPASIPRTGDWWSDREEEPRLTLRLPCPAPRSISDAYIPAEWPLTHTSQAPPRPAAAMLAFLGVLPATFLEDVARAVAGASEVKLKKIRKALSRVVPALCLRLLDLAFTRYRRSHAARRAAWAADTSTWLAGEGGDALALRLHQRARDDRDRREADRRRKDLSNRLAVARFRHVAQACGMTPTQYRALTNQTRRSTFLTVRPEDVHHLQSFDPESVIRPPLRPGLRSSTPGRVRRVYSDSYVSAPGDHDFGEGLRNSVRPAADVLAYWGGFL
jgi:hypothetical protein